MSMYTHPTADCWPIYLFLNEIYIYEIYDKEFQDLYDQESFLFFLTTPRNLLI